MSVEISRGIQLPLFDIEMLNRGKLIAVPFKQYLREGETFWLYPSQQLPSGLSLEQYYQPRYLARAQAALEKDIQAPVQLMTWGKCDYHWHLYPNDKHLLPEVAQSTLWRLDALEKIFAEHQVLKLLFLQVHRFSAPCIIKTPRPPAPFFFSQPEDRIVPARKEDEPVVSKTSFERRKILMMRGEVYPHLALEDLQLQLEPLESSSLRARKLDHDIKQLLGWSSPYKFPLTVPPWMNTITALGDRSKEDDEGKSNYQAGTDFEEIVRKSLETLGFTVDYSHKGGAGGVDIFCSKPYPLIGECKSGKKIPNSTAVQLLNLGTLRIQEKEVFQQATKLIIGSGEPTDQLIQAAKVHGMAIINPATLQRLVQVHHVYPIDLYKLRDALTDGRADDPVKEYLNQHLQSVWLRKHIIHIVKDFLERSLDSDADVSQIHAAYIVNKIKPPQPLKREEMHDILIELSSPLVGYLGRRKDNDGTDRFYFVRHMPG